MRKIHITPITPHETSSADVITKTAVRVLDNFYGMERKISARGRNFAIGGFGVLTLGGDTGHVQDRHEKKSEL